MPRNAGPAGRAHGRRGGRQQLLAQRWKQAEQALGAPVLTNQVQFSLAHASTTLGRSLCPSRGVHVVTSRTAAGAGAACRPARRRGPTQRRIRRINRCSPRRTYPGRRVAGQAAGGLAGAARRHGGPRSPWPGLSIIRESVRIPGASGWGRWKSERSRGGDSRADARSLGLSAPPRRSLLGPFRRLRWVRRRRHRLQTWEGLRDWLPFARSRRERVPGGRVPGWTSSVGVGGRDRRGAGPSRGAPDSLDTRRTPCAGGGCMP